jgi:O-antigen ligase
VAAYAALAAGIGAISWMAGTMRRSPALLLVAGGTSMVVLSHTRTALIALVAGVTVGAATLFATRRRVRRVVTTALVFLAVTGAFLVPAISDWFTRDQTGEQLGNLTGRRTVWDALLAAPRPAFNRWLGYGLSDKSFNGLAIDSTWLAVYQDQGLVGVAVVAVMLLSVLIVANRRPPGAPRALATFVIVYCAVASYTEVTVGDASPYLLVVFAAASLVVPAGTARFPSPVIP